MSDGDRGEKMLINNSSSKSWKRYGSTSQYVKQDHYITHQVQTCDTLQGLALKYNTTTEQIRRVNRLFASDSLFLRNELKIPVAREIAEELNPAMSNNNHSRSASTSDSNALTSSISTESYSDDDEKFANNFLDKIDSAIASTRAQVKHVQQNSHFVEASDVTMPKRRQNKRPAPASLQSSSAAVADQLPSAVVLNNDRSVRNSLQRLQNEQDVLFEL